MPTVSQHAAHCRNTYTESVSGPTTSPTRSRPAEQVAVDSDDEDAALDLVAVRLENGGDAGRR